MNGYFPRFGSNFFGYVLLCMFSALSCCRTLIRVDHQLKGRLQGFTLLELLIVLMIISLVTGVVVPRLGDSLGKVQVKAVVNRTSAILRAARNMAVTHQVAWQVRCDTDAGTVVMEPVPESGERETLPGSQDALVKTFGRKVYAFPEGIRIEEIYDGRGERVEDGEIFLFTFYPVGNCSGGQLVFKSKGGRVYRVRVDFITGLVDVSD